MKRSGIVLGVVLSSVFVGGTGLAAEAKPPAVAQDFTVSMVKISEVSLAEWIKNGGQVRTGNGILAVDPLAVYSNLTTFSGTATTMTGSGIPCATVTGNDITGIQADDITFPLNPGASAVPAFNTFYVFNGNAASVTVRPRWRMWNTTGAGGGPGTYVAGYSAGAPYPTIAAGSVAGFRFNGTTTPALTPGATNNFWYGLQFDNNTGGIVGLTCTQLSLLGIGIFGPVDVGSSTTNIFNGNVAASQNVNNPTGVTAALAAGQSLGWEIGVLTLPVQLMNFNVN